MCVYYQTDLFIDESYFFYFDDDNFIINMNKNVVFLCSRFICRLINLSARASWNTSRYTTIAKGPTEKKIEKNVKLEAQ